MAVCWQSIILLFHLDSSGSQPLETNFFGLTYDFLYPLLRFFSSHMEYDSSNLGAPSFFLRLQSVELHLAAKPQQGG